MSNSFLSQEEIDALLNPKNDDEETDGETEENLDKTDTDVDKTTESESSGSGEMDQAEIDAMLNQEDEDAPVESSESGEMSQAEIDAMLNHEDEDEDVPAESSASGEMDQAEIDAMLNQEREVKEPAKEKHISAIYSNLEIEEGLLNDVEIDALGEVGNISAGSASTALSDLLSHRVTINTPKVFVVKPEQLISNLIVPYVLLEVHYISGLTGTNLLILKHSDVSIISDIMMGGLGDNPDLELDEIRISAISEAMNQMVGSSATAMSEIFKKKVNISPPQVTSVDVNMDDFTYEWGDDKEVVVTAFNIQIDGKLDSEIFQIIPLEVAKQEVRLLMEVTTGLPYEELAPSKPESAPKTKEEIKTQVEPEAKEEEEEEEAPKAEKTGKIQEEISAPQFASLSTPGEQVNQENLDLILDVPLKISVVLGKTQRPINEILDLNPGSIVELGKHANEPVDILVNGNLIAQGEVVVVNENYGVKVTKILSAENRIRRLGKG